ncbi:hypothetical protein [Pararhizobium haloflavum]|uniref:hypothetical protein n=1 Tax=Pararhizobium haloflavum TaxID=2037914 RepID=UPI000C185192|nr:hypothetical protein [Pararhizobium haloflavum]
MPELGRTGADNAIGLYRLVPIARADDPNWDRAPGHGEIVVAARSPADARLVAAEAEGDFLGSGAKPGDGNSTLMASAFRDDKLYTVIEEGEADGDIRRGVVSGRIGSSVIKPDQLRD